MNRNVVATLVASWLSLGQAALAQQSPETPAVISPVGLWEICLETGDSTSASPRHMAVAGYLTLMPLETTPVWINLGVPTHYGIYALDLAPLGIHRDPRLPIPLVGARVQGDTMVLMLNPFGSHGPILLWGRLGKGQVSGTWSEQAYVGGGSGSFKMSLIEERRLPLPYPIDGPVAAPPISGCPVTAIEDSTRQGSLQRPAGADPEPDNLDQGCRSCDRNERNQRS